MRKPSRNPSIRRVDGNSIRVLGKQVADTYAQMVCLFRYEQYDPIWTSWFFRTVSLRQALQQVKDGTAKPVTRKIDGVITTIGYQAQQPELQGDPTPCMLTPFTTEAVSNSVAAEGFKPDLSSKEREEIFRFTVWPFIGDTRAVCVRPRTTEAQRILVDKLCPVSRFARPLARAA